MNVQAMKMVLVFMSLGARVVVWDTLTPEEKSTTERQFVQTMIKLFQVEAKDRLDDESVIQEGLLIATGQLTQCLCDSSPMTDEDVATLIDYLVRNNESVTEDIATTSLRRLVDVAALSGICTAVVGKTAVAVVNELTKEG